VSVAEEGMRLARYLARGGVTSRRGAEELIRAGRVKVNGAVATDLGRRVRPGTDEVRVDGRVIAAAEEEATLLHHKPKGVLVSRSDPHHEGQTVYDLLPPEFAGLAARLVYAGRLDLESEGLLVLSTDGDLVNRLVHPRHHVEKEYEVTLDAPLTNEQVQALARGVDLEDGRTLPCVVERLRNSRVRMVLREGRNRQIRRMMDTVGRRVVRLVRLRIGGLELGELEVGKFRQAGESDLMLLERDGPKGG